MQHNKEGRFHLSEDSISIDRATVREEIYERVQYLSPVEMLEVLLHCVKKVLTSTFQNTEVKENIYLFWEVWSGGFNAGWRDIQDGLDLTIDSNKILNYQFQYLYSIWQICNQRVQLKKSKKLKIFTKIKDRKLKKQINKLTILFYKVGDVL